MTATPSPPPSMPELPLRDKLAQLMFVRIGSNLPPVRTVEEDEARIAALLPECPIGGLVLFNGRHGPTADTLARLQQQSRYPLLVGSDIERGYGQQLRPYPLFPHAMAFDALGADAVDAVRKFAAITAVAARRAGVHITFAPIADVNTDPRNPIIATRAFSTEPARAAELAAAFVEGCRDGELLATAKHFPGHGDTHQDSHHELPNVPQSGDEIRRRELEPFRAAIAAGVPLIMTAHVCYPGLDDSGACATLSRPILTDLLRGELGYQGAVVSDSLLMAGVREQAATEGELCVRAVNAGVDILLDVESPVAAVEAMAAAVESGALPISRVDEALARVVALKQTVWVHGSGDADKSTPLESLSADQLESETRTFAQQVAAAAIQVVRGDAAPLDPVRPTLTVLVNPYRSHLDPETPELFAAVRELCRDVECVELRGDEPAPRWEALSQCAAAVDQVLVAIVVKPAAWHQFGLPVPAADWLTTACQRSPLVLACLGAPIALESFPAARSALCTFSDVPVSQRALAERLFAVGAAAQIT